MPKIKYEIFGASHSAEIGVRMEGVRFGEEINIEELQRFLNRRKAVNAAYSTARIEPDEIIIESGIENGITTGGEIVAKIVNVNVKRGDYSALKYCPRPSHADYAAYKKYGEDYDFSGGGKFSGRMTAPMCIAGGIALQILKRKGVFIGAYIQSIGGVNGRSYKFCGADRQTVEDAHNRAFPVLDESYVKPFEREISGAAGCGDSIGGVVECCIFGLPAGCGDAMCGSLESLISAEVFAIPAVKGVEFGSGFDLTHMRGSCANDEFYFDERGEVKTYSNHNGGINGGIANGMPVTFRVAFKPTPSIAKEQNTVNLKTGENVKITIRGRHDSCFVPRAVPAVEAVTALALLNVIDD